MRPHLHFCRPTFRLESCSSLLLLVLLSLGVRAQAAEAEYVPDEILVKFGNGGRVGPALAARLATAQAVNAQIKTSRGTARTLRDFAFIGWQHVKLPPGLSVPDAIARFKKLKGVIDVQPNYVLHASDTTPNDTRYSELWGMAKIKAPTAWDTTTGSSNIVVAVIDTGVDYTHPDLAANMWHNPGEIPGNGQDDDGDGYVDDVYGIDVANNDSDPMDDQYHGTHCAGTIGAVGNNGVGVAGVNWGVKIMALKYLSANGSGDSSNAIKCVQYALALKTRAVNPVNIRVTSNSYGGTGDDLALKSAFDAIGNAGVINICAAGNSAANNDNPATASYPASDTSDSIVSVAASDQNDNRATFSNYGVTSVDLAAPGVDIFSTTPNNTYSLNSGTSMATPHVAGAAALKLAQSPNLSVAELKALLLGTVDKVKSWSGLVVSGGRLNLDRLLRGDQTYKDVRLLAPATGSTVANPNLMRATYSSLPVETPTRVDFVAQPVFRSLPNKVIGSTVSDSISVNASGTVSSIAGSFTIDYVSAGSYSIYLTAPDGTNAKVQGISAPNGGIGIYSINFSTSLTAFTGKKLPGLWTITVTTGSSSNRAILKSWGLNFGNVVAPQTLSDTDGPDSNGEYTATWTPEGGVYNVTAIAYNAAGDVLDSDTHTDVQFPVIVQSGPSFVVTKTADIDDGVCSTRDCSLREAINAANRYSGETPNISFDSTVFAAPRQTITLSSGFYIARDININGPAAGVTLDANHQSGFFSQSAYNLSLNNLNLLNGQGTGLFADYDASLYLNNCTVSGNSGGSVVYVRGGASLSNCTLTGNSGGAINSEIYLVVNNCTIAGNSGGGISSGGQLYMSNSLLAGNGTGGSGPDLSGSVTSGDYNLVQNTSSATLSGTHNVTGQAPKLGALSENGGPTPTLALLAGSPAINAGDPAVNGAGQFDQRGSGFPRVQNGRLDIGAFESAVSTNAAPVITVSAPNNSATLARNLFLSTLGGSASDDKGVSSASISLFRKRNNANEFWNGNAWTAAQVYVPLQLASAGATTTGWSWTQQTPALSKLDNGLYGLYVKASDADNATSTQVRRDFTLSTPSNNNAPTISVSSPNNGAVVARNLFLSTLGGSASDDYGVSGASISLFRKRNGANEFWNGTAWTATQVYVPLQLASVGATTTGWSWSQQAPSVANLDSGLYGLYVRATDADNVTGTSVRRDFSLSTPSNNLAPTISVSAPNNGAVIARNLFLSTLSGTVSDDYGVSSASISLFRKRNNANEFWNGTAWVATQVYVPLQLSSVGATSTGWTWSQQTPGVTNLDNGLYGLYVKASDADSATGAQVRRDFTLSTPSNNTAPVITVAAPDNGATIARNLFLSTLGGSASDDYGVSGASISLFRKRNGANEFWNGTAWVATQVYVPLQLANVGATTTGWSWTLQAPALSNLDNGLYGLYVKATDADSATGAQVRRDFTLSAPSSAIRSGRSSSAPAS